MTLSSQLLSLINAIGLDIKTLQSNIYYNEQGMLPASVKQSNMPATSVLNMVTSLSSGRLSLVRCPVKKGQQISAISFFSVNQATAATNQVFALYNPNRTLISTTSNDTNTQWPGNTRKRLVLTTPYTPSADGFVYAGIAVTATIGVPTLAGIITGLQITGLAPILHGSSNTGVTNPASFPSTANALTAIAGVPLVMLD